jgi:hypothetical protein
MNLTRAAAALAAATAVALGITTPAGANHQATPRAVTAPIDYGSGIWGGPVGSPSETGDLATADVALFGDSIGARCRTAIAAALAAKGLTTYTWTYSGQNTRGIVDGIMSAPRLPGVVIVEAGTNDVFDPFAASAEVSRAANYLTETGVRWHWIDTYVGRPATLADDVRNSGQVSAVVHGVVGEERIIRWVDALTAARGRGRPLSYYLQDGVHPWAAAGTGHGDGCAFLAAVIAGELP